MRLKNNTWISIIAKSFLTHKAAEEGEIPGHANLPTLIRITLLPSNKHKSALAGSKIFWEQNWFPIEEPVR